MTPTTYARTRTDITIDFWLDLTCPWCYIARHRLAVAIKACGASVQLRARSYQLDAGPVDVPQQNSESEMPSNVNPESDAVGHERRLQTLATSEGLRYEVDRPDGKTQTFHQLLQLANRDKRGYEFFSATQDGLFAGQLNPFAPDDQIAQAAAFGLTVADVRTALCSQEYRDAAAVDKLEARALGAIGVPFMKVGPQRTVSGAVSALEYAAALAQATPGAPFSQASAGSE